MLMMQYEFRTSSRVNVNTKIEGTAENNLFFSYSV